MTERRRGDDRATAGNDTVRAILHRARRLDPPTPDFATLIEARRSRPALVPRLALAATLLVAVIASLLIVDGGWRPSPGDPDLEEVLRLAESISTWRGPLEFLHQEPAAELLPGDARFGAATEPLTAAFATLDLDPAAFTVADPIGDR